MSPVSLKFDAHKSSDNEGGGYEVAKNNKQPHLDKNYH